MNDIINRLRDATQAVGETIDHPPGLSLGESRTRRSWLVPVAAAASVTVAVAGGVAVVRGGDGGLGQVAAAGAGPAAVPNFFAEAGDDGITIRSVDGGSETSRVPEPSDRERFVSIQAAQDNRLFYAVSASDDCRPRLYRFLLDDAGKVGSFDTLPFAPPAGTRPTSLAVSGDGAKLAYGTAPCGREPGTGSLVVADTATGDSRTWIAKDGTGATNLSMTADGRFVLFTRDVVGGVAAVAEPAVVEPSLVPSVEGSAVPSSEATLMATGAPSPVPTMTAEPAKPVMSEPTESVAPSPVPSAVPPEVPSVAPSAVPSDMPTAVPTVAPSLVPTVEAMSWCRFSAESVPAVRGDAALTTEAAKVEPGSGPVELKQTIWVCPDSPEVRLLDTGAPGDSLDKAATFSLWKPGSEVASGVLGAKISPDGTRIVAALGAVGVGLDGGKLPPGSGPFGLAAFSAADGGPLGVFYREAGTPGLRLLDIDGTGENMLVTRDGEIGVVDGKGYRTLVDAGDALVNFGSRIAW
ncbi:hypothetical protein [Microtetraspora sp. NBRC 16547]|uniref:hypothetical protein n=1 Tax=Microtetraspora sp. NBRC 16547 TaxID=3030993 RepID=UPI0024A4AA63|nr:hypothetical protein [Microtetraspora sp. NBRC 16547]GLX01438.1 hypothetical protein Misp02_55240 [Microtetraspora sp. NBRC 16547]